MSAELSRRGAYVMRAVVLREQSFLDFSFALDAAADFDELPDWARQALLNAEQRVGVSPFI